MPDCILTDIFVLPSIHQGRHTETNTDSLGIFIHDDYPSLCKGGILYIRVDSKIENISGFTEVDYAGWGGGRGGSRACHSYPWESICWYL